MDQFERAQASLREFASARDWEQFHTPKNLVMALAGEVGELAAVFQWLTPEESTAVMSGDDSERVRDELADVASYLLRLADVLSVDLIALLDAKIARNQERYPVELARGSAARYDHLNRPASS